MLDKVANFIKPWEQLRLKAYRISVKGKQDVWTIGWGTTKGVQKGDTITRNAADALLYQDIKQCLGALNRLTKVPLTDNQAIALCDFIYNLGAGAYQCSTLLIKLNRGEYENAAVEFKKWVFFKGIILNGLVRRRLAERTLFML